MKISYNDEQKRLLRTCGVPSGLIQDFTINWKDYIQTLIDNDNEKPLYNYSIKDQIDTIRSLAKINESKAKTIVLSAVDELTLLRKFTVPWFFNACEWSIQNPKHSLGTLPVWHYIDFSFNDSLLTTLRGKEASDNFNDCKPMLVLDGVSTDSSGTKVEKLRDILNLSLDHTVILLLGGEKPFEFCKSKLGFKPKHFAQFSAARVRHSLL